MGTARRAGSARRQGKARRAVSSQNRLIPSLGQFDLQDDAVGGHIIDDENLAVHGERNLLRALKLLFHNAAEEVKKSFLNW